MNRITVLATVVLMSAVTSRAADWPQWLGPNRDGISAESDWSAKWASGGPKKLWSKSIGIGFGSMSVGDGRVYTMGHRGGQETVFCFDANTGKEIWKESYPAQLVNRLHEGGPSSTPTIDGDRVFTVGKDGKFMCFEAANGKVVWTIDLVKEFRVKVPEWGFCSSPLILGNLVIVEAGPTVAYAKATGKMVWKSSMYKAAYGSAMAFEQNGKTLIASLNSMGLVILDAKNGREISRVPWKTQYDTNSTTPLIVDDTIFISTGYGKGCGLFQVRGGKLTKIYTNKTMANHFNNSVLVDGHLYGFNGNSHRSSKVSLVCMEFKTGKEKWRETGLLGCGSLIAADGKLIVLSDRGVLYVAEASPKGFLPTARAQLVGDAKDRRNRCWTIPVLANGKIYARNARGDLVCADVGK